MQIIKNYITNNDGYKKQQQIEVKGLMIHSVGTPQPKAYPFINTWNKSGIKSNCHLIIESADKAYQLLPCLENFGKAHRGWHCGGDGNNLYIGVEMTEPDTIQYISGASFKDLNPLKTKEHILSTYNGAVDLFAKLCTFHNLNPLDNNVIISHSLGYKLGLASNHGDVEHLWTYAGLSLSQFRTDIYNKMQIEDDGDMTQEQFNTMMNNYLTELAKQPGSTWSKEARDWAEQTGLIVGDTQGNKMYKKFLTREEMAALLKRFYNMVK